jgi:glycosyltransferase involved in cell wall biosynthesis
MIVEQKPPSSRNQQPLFSVIVPTYDRRDFLAEAIGSVLSQTVGDLECIVVDDASPRPAEIPDDPRVRLFRRNENGGEPVARNTGLRLARGRFVCFLDDDDVYAPERLAAALEGLGRAPVSICCRREFDGPVGRNRMLDGDVYDSILDGLTPQMGQVAVERAAVLPFDERFDALADVDWWIRTARESRVTTVPIPGLLYRSHPGPRNRNGLEARVRCSHLLLEAHAAYFAGHPRAEAFRWRRIGLMAERLGDISLARRALRRGLRRHPDIRGCWHLARLEAAWGRRVRTEIDVD